MPRKGIKISWNWISLFLIVMNPVIVTLYFLITNVFAKETRVVVNFLKNKIILVMNII